MQSEQDDRATQQHAGNAAGVVAGPLKTSEGVRAAPVVHKTVKQQPLSGLGAVQGTAGCPEAGRGGEPSHHHLGQAVRVTTALAAGRRLRSAGHVCAQPTSQLVFDGCHYSHTVPAAGAAAAAALELICSAAESGVAGGGHMLAPKQWKLGLHTGAADPAARARQLERRPAAGWRRQRSGGGSTGCFRPKPARAAQPTVN